MRFLTEWARIEWPQTECRQTEWPLTERPLTERALRSTPWYFSATGVATLQIIGNQPTGRA